MSDHNNVSSFLTGLIVGATAGALAGVLLAPKSGKETRDDILKIANDIADKATDSYSMAKKELEKRIDAVKGIGEKIDQKKYKTLVDQVVKEFKKDKAVTAEVAKKIGEQLSSDWDDVKLALKS